MKTYLITGGAGFIGANYIHYLMKNKQNIQIINLDNLEYFGNPENLKEVEELSHYRFLKGDICDRELVCQLFHEAEIDYVVHFAAMTHVDRSIESARPFIHSNIEGTLTLLETALEAWEIDGQFPGSKKFLYVSTDEVYGDLRSEGYFTEDTPIAPRNPYSASKASAEMLVRAFGETHGLPYHITRCSNNYGPYQFPEKLIPLLIHNCLRHAELPIYGDGQNIRDWLYVEDHCSAIEAVLKRGKPGAVYNIGGHNEKTTLEIAEIIVDYIHYHHDPAVTRDLIRHVADRKGHDRRYAIDPRKTREELFWKPSVTFETGIIKTIQWYLENTEWLSHVVSGEYLEYYERHYGSKTKPDAIYNVPYKVDTLRRRVPCL